MGPKRKRPPSGVLILTTGRTDQIAHDVVLADLRLWVKLRRTQCEHMFSALPSNSDIARRIRDVSKVPGADMTRDAMFDGFRWTPARQRPAGPRELR